MPISPSASSDGVTDTYGYDPAGNRTSHARTGEFEQAAVYDPAGQLRQATTAGDANGSASFDYDAAGNRTGQNVDGVGTTFGYDLSGRNPKQAQRSSRTKGRRLIRATSLPSAP